MIGLAAVVELALADEKFVEMDADHLTNGQDIADFRAVHVLEVKNLRDLAFEAAWAGGDRGALTSTQSAISSPANSNSPFPRKREAEDAFIAAPSAEVVMFHTNSPVSSAKVSVSLGPSLEKPISGAARQRR